MNKIERIAHAWGVGINDAKEIIEKMKMYDGRDTIVSDCEFAGTIDNDNVADKISGHTGFWLAEKTSEFDGGGYVRFITNGDPVDSGFDEAIADTIGVEWTDFDEAFEGYKI
jgi:hypothetical protein